MNKRRVPTSIIVAGVILGLTSVALISMLFTGPVASSGSYQGPPVTRSTGSDSTSFAENPATPADAPVRSLVRWVLAVIVVGSLGLMVFSVTRELVALRRERHDFERLPAEKQARLHEAGDTLHTVFSGAPAVADTAATRAGRAEARAIARDEKAKRRLAGR
jgi:hypothetical protein